MNSLHQQNTRNQNKILDLIGIGIGPFNLSLAALLEKVPNMTNIFFEKKSAFDWHPEIMFSDSMMQTTFLTDLVTPVDPTSPFSFLNYIFEKGLFYQFLNTERKIISRKEFEQYCIWVSQKLEYKLKFNSEIKDVSFSKNSFQVHTSQKTFESHNICIATGHVPRLPNFAKKFVGPQFFHAKSDYLQNMNLKDKSVVIVGAGQTGVEIFGNILNGKWGHVKSVQLVASKTPEAFEESPFTSDYFTPTYVNNFWDLSSEKKIKVVDTQKNLSDANTPDYLVTLYHDLYRLKHVENDLRDLRILAYRRLVDVEKFSDGFRLILENNLYNCKEEILADVVILSTGFENVIPKILEPLQNKIKFDSKGRFIFKKSYAIEWDGPEKNRIYALNFSRYNHGIVDPQTSLMAWRSGAVINDLTKKRIYSIEPKVRNFVQYEPICTLNLEIPKNSIQ